MHFFGRHTYFLKICRILIVLLFIRKVKCGEAWEDNPCASLFSGVNFDGEAFILKDWDQSVNTNKDYRSSIAGWGNTRSIRVEEKCYLTICDHTYFQGTCQKLSKGYYPASEVISPLKSANCTCERICRCEDVFVPKTSQFCGKAYINASCYDCNSEYAYLWHHAINRLSSKIGMSIKALKLRKGCNLTIWSDSEDNGSDTGTLLTSEFVELENSQTIGDYECSCDDDKFDPPSVSYSPLVNLPNTDQVVSMLVFNLPDHPGITAAIKSMEAGRSSRNAYIILIGTEWTDWIVGTSGCDGGLETISECHFPLGRDVVGVSNAQLRVITVPIEQDGNFTSDDMWIATLDDYLSSHEDLKDSIPNAVVVFYYQTDDNEINQQTSWFQRQLRVLNALRYRLLDEDYSNVVHLLCTRSFSYDTIRNPEQMLVKFENAIKDNWDFPKPTFIVPRDYVYNYDRFVNGYWLMKNGEYAPRNLYRNLILLSEKGGDALGNAIFKAISASNDGLTGILNNERSLFPINHPKVELYSQMSNSGILLINDTKFTERFEQRKVLGSKNAKPPYVRILELEAKLDNFIENALKNTPQNTLLNLQKSSLQTALQNLTERVILIENVTSKRVSKLEKEIKDGRETLVEDLKQIQRSIWKKIKVDLRKIFE